jgi:hypothetical protein
LTREKEGKGMKQYNIGWFFGLYWTQLQFSASYIGFISFAMVSTTMWVLAGKSLQELFPWLSFALFALLIFVSLFLIIPWLDYKFMQKTRQAYLNEQGWKHDNPTRLLLERMERRQIRICRQLGISEED